MKRYAWKLLIIGILLISIGISYIFQNESPPLTIENKQILLSPTLHIKQKPTIQSNINSKSQTKVVRVVDGDTIELESGEKVRYIGINAPETGQPFASSASALNSTLVLGKTVTLEFDVQTKDQYGRLLAYVYVDTVMVNTHIVQEGMAVIATFAPNVKYQDAILKAQQEARESCKGMWESLCKPKNVQGTSTITCIKITSIHADAPGDDNINKNGEWIEITNSCDRQISLEGWLLKDSSASNSYSFDKLFLKAQSNILLYSGCGINTVDKLYWQCPEGKYAVWNNGGDHAFLYNEHNELVSEYKY